MKPSWMGIRGLPRMVQAQLRAHEDTLRRLVTGNFDDLSIEARRQRVEEIIRLSATAALGLAAAPVPFLEVPVQAAMVRSIAKVYGATASGRKVMLQLGAAMGGGLVLRQLLRLVPFAGSASLMSRVYGATWALGRVAALYYEQEGGVSRESMRAEFDETMTAKQAESEQRLSAVEFERRLGETRELRDKGLITDAEFATKRDELLAML